MRIGLLICGVILLIVACPKQRQPLDTPLTQGGVPEERTRETMQEMLEQNTGLPFVLELPAEAHAEEYLDLLRPTFSLDQTNWSTEFVFHGGFPVLVKSFDEQLKTQGFARLSGPSHDVDVNFLPDSGVKPTQAYGKKVWISEDRRILAFLIFNFKRATETEPEINHYELNVMKRKEPVEVKEPNKIVPIM